jgi:hypothetical protein
MIPEPFARRKSFGKKESHWGALRFEYFLGFDGRAEAGAANHQFPVKDKMAVNLTSEP